MQDRLLACFRGTGAALALVALTVSAVSAQDVEIPRTPWGAPDLQGVWDRRTNTRFQRPRELGNKAVYTEEEAAVIAAERGVVDVPVIRTHPVLPARMSWHFTCLPNSAGLVPLSA